MELHESCFVKSFSGFENCTLEVLVVWSRCPSQRIKLSYLSFSLLSLSPCSLSPPLILSLPFAPMLSVSGHCLSRYLVPIFIWNIEIITFFNNGGNDWKDSFVA